MDKTKIISVVMPTYNTELSMLKEAVESILNQTFCDFEFIIIDDGSTNGSDEYLNSLQDERIRIIQNPTNIGITKITEYRSESCERKIHRPDGCRRYFCSNAF